MWPFRRKRRRREREIGEAEAYQLLHGDRSDEVRVVAVQQPPAVPPRRGHHVTVEGETLRTAFERKFAQRLARREKRRAD
jgi:hypothetical protein